MKITDRFDPPPVPAGALFVPFVQIGRTLYVSGHIARRDGKPWIGRLGETMTTEEGKQAARAVAFVPHVTQQEGDPVSRNLREAKRLEIYKS